jgi:2-polyprenyl-6-hydroxyphenyl methylase/3-demethylubiquinone-9 3-methyltransferase
VGFCQRRVATGSFTSQSRRANQSLARLGAHTTGIDASESNITIAKLHASADPKLSQLSYVHTPAESLLASPKRYDVVCSMEVLEHVDNPASFLSTCAELLKVRNEQSISNWVITSRINSREVIFSSLQSPARRLPISSPFCSPRTFCARFLRARTPTRNSSSLPN